MELGSLICSRRKARGLTQEQLAEAVGVARQTVSKWETGETVPDAESLGKLASVLGFSVDRALGLEPEEDEDGMAWLILGGTVIGLALGLALSAPLLGVLGAMAGLGVGLCRKGLGRR